MNADVLRLCEAVRVAGGRAMLVGGSVRDHLFGIESKDFDLEVYGLEPKTLREVLEQIGHVNTVGEHFSVYKIIVFRPSSLQSAIEATQIETAEDPEAERTEIDVSLPRRESKSGPGHRAFVIEGDPAMSFEEAARRRDFTINAILYDPLTGERVDPFGGEEDLSRRVLRAVDPETFIEDSLRVLRAVQLAARFELTIEPATISLCRTIDLSDLPHERIWGEIEKLLLLAEHPSIGLDAALELCVLDKLFPEISGLKEIAAVDVRGSVNALNHTSRALDSVVKIVNDLSKPRRLAVMLATFCHYLGAQFKDASSGAAPQVDASDPTGAILDRLGLYTIGGFDVRSEVLSLVRERLKPREFYRDRETITDGDFRRLAQRVNIDLLYRVAKAYAVDQQSAGASVAVDWFLARARSLEVEQGPPAPLIQGRHLLEVGFAPGPQMGKVLRGVYELQLDGKVKTSEEALAAARELDSSP